MSLFPYISVPAIRIFLNAAQREGSWGRSKVCKWLSQNILVCSKWDILDPKMTCASGSTIEKNPQKFNFFVVVSFRVYQHPQAFPITWCHPPSVPLVPHCPLSSGDPYMKLSLRTWGDILLKIPSSSDNLRKNHWKMKGAKRYMKRRRCIKIISTNFLPKKIIVWGKWTISGPKLAHPCNSGLTIIAHELTPKTYRFLITSECLFSKKVW